MLLRTMVRVYNEIPIVFSTGWLGYHNMNFCDVNIVLLSFYFK